MGRARSRHAEVDSLPASYMKLKLAYTALLLLGSCDGASIPPVAAHGSHWVIQPVKWLGSVTEIMALKWSLSSAACGSGRFRLLKALMGKGCVAVQNMCWL